MVSQDKIGVPPSSTGNIAPEVLDSGLFRLPWQPQMNALACFWYFNQMPCTCTLKWYTLNQLPVICNLFTLAKVDPAFEYDTKLGLILKCIFILFFILWPKARKRIGLPHLNYTFLESAQYSDFVGFKHRWMYTVIPYNTDVGNFKLKFGAMHSR